MPNLRSPQIYDATAPCLEGATVETKALLARIRNTNGHLLLGAERSISLSGVVSQEVEQMIQITDGHKPAVVGYVLQAGATNNTPQIQKDYADGAIIALLDHIPNPVTWTGWSSYSFNAGTNSETSGAKDLSAGNAALVACLPGGAQRARWLSYIDTCAAWLNSLVDYSGKKIPVVLRALHEQMGAWYWWHGYDSKSTLVSLFQDYVDRLRYNGVTNVLICWNTTVNSGAGTAYTYADYSPLYPGDSYCDIIGVNVYSEQAGGSLRHGWIRSGFAANAQLAGERNKPLTIPEMGFVVSAGSWSATSEDFWYEVVLPDLKANFRSARWLQFWDTKWGPFQLSSSNLPGAKKMLSDPIWITR